MMKINYLKLKAATIEAFNCGIEVEFVCGPKNWSSGG